MFSSTYLSVISTLNLAAHSPVYLSYRYSVLLTTPQGKAKDLSFKAEAKNFGLKAKAKAKAEA